MSLVEITATVLGSTETYQVVTPVGAYAKSLYCPCCKRRWTVAVWLDHLRAARLSAIFRKWGT